MFVTKIIVAKNQSSYFHAESEIMYIHHHNQIKSLKLITVIFNDNDDNYSVPVMALNWINNVYSWLTITLVKNANMVRVELVAIRNSHVENIKYCKYLSFKQFNHLLHLILRGWQNFCSKLQFCSSSDFILYSMKKIWPYHSFTHSFTGCNF